jgi:excisionase family DNA binding protein
MSGYVSVSEAARIKNVTRQAIYLAIRLKRLRAYKHGDAWKIFLVDLDEYDKQRYSRAISTFNGELIFDETKGYISMEKASEMIGVPKQKLYYAARTGKLKAVRKRQSWVIKVEDLLAYQDEYLTKDFTRKVLN